MYVYCSLSGMQSKLMDSVMGAKMEYHIQYRGSNCPIVASPNRNRDKLQLCGLLLLKCRRYKSFKLEQTYMYELPDLLRRALCLSF